MKKNSKDLYDKLNYLSKQDNIPTIKRIKIVQALSRLEQGFNITKSQRETFGEYQGLVDKKERVDLQKRLAYERQKYNKNYKKELTFVNDLWKSGASRTKGAIDQQFGKGDTWRNKYYRMTNEELQEIIDKFKELNQGINSNTKRKADFVSKSLSILIDSLQRGHITYQEFKKEVNMLQKRGVSLGLNKEEVKELMDRVYADYDMIG